MAFVHSAARLIRMMAPAFFSAFTLLASRNRIEAQFNECELRRMSQFQTERFAGRVAASDRFVAATSTLAGTGRLHVFDKALGLLSQTDFVGRSTGLAIRNPLVAVAEGSAGLALIDAADPRNPSILSTLPTSGSAIDVAIEGNLAVVTEGMD